MRKSLENIELAQPTETKSAASLACRKETENFGSLAVAISNKHKQITAMGLLKMKTIILTCFLATVSVLAFGQDYKLKTKYLDRKESAKDVLGKVGENYVVVKQVKSGLINDHMEIALLDKDLNQVDVLAYDSEDYSSTIDFVLKGNNLEIFWKDDGYEYSRSVIQCSPKLKFLSDRELFYKVPEKYFKLSSAGKGFAFPALGGLTRSFEHSENGEFHHLSLSINDNNKLIILSVLLDENYELIKESTHELAVPQKDSDTYHYEVLGDNGMVLYFMNTLKSSSLVGKNNKVDVKPGIGVYYVSQDGKGKFKQLTNDGDELKKVSSAEAFDVKVRNNKAHFGCFTISHLVYGIIDLNANPQDWKLQTKKYEDETLYTKNMGISVRINMTETKQIEGNSGGLVRLNCIDMVINEDGSFIFTGQQFTRVILNDGRSDLFAGSVFVVKVKDDQVVYSKVINNAAESNGPTASTIVTDDNDIIILVGHNRRNNLYCVDGLTEKLEENKVDEKDNTYGALFEISSDGEIVNHPLHATDKKNKLWPNQFYHHFSDGERFISTASVNNSGKSGYLILSF